MPRRRGITVELLDYQALAAACADAGLSPLNFGGNALLRQAGTGRTVALSTEGVGSQTYGEGVTYLDTQSFTWQALPTPVVEACRTGETQDLADFIRTFGSRLDVNHLLWWEWATNEGAD